MIIFKNLKLTKIYFWLAFGVSLIMMLFTPVGIRNYVPVLFGFTSFILFSVNMFGYLYKFSKELKEKESEIFKKNEVPYGYHQGKLIMLTNICDEDEFKKIKEPELFDLYKDLKGFNLLVIYAFLAIIVLSIFLIETNPIL